MTSTRGPVFVLALVGAITLGALVALWLEREGGASRGGPAEAQRTEHPGEDLRAPAAADGPAHPSARVEGRAGAAPRAQAPLAPELPLGTLSGRVLDSSRRPLAGVSVSLMRSEAREFTLLDPQAGTLSTLLDETYTSDDGAFRFALARGLPVDVAAALEGYSEALVPDAYAGQELELVLEPGALVHGIVRRARDRSPVEGARVRVFPAGGPASLERETRSAPDGSYQLRIPFRSEALLEVVPAREQCSPWLTLAIGPDERCEQDVLLEDGVRVTGRITDAVSGAPIAGATVGEGWWFRRTATSDARGEYSLEGFGAPGVRELGVRARGYGAARTSSPPEPREGVVRLDFALERARSVAGRVVDEAGAPLEGAYVAAVASEFGEGGQRTDWVSTRTDAGGRYAIGDLTRELGHALFVSKHGYGTQVHDFPETEFESGALELPDVVLRRPALLAGRVEDPRGGLLADVEVELLGWNHDRYRFTARETARARFYVDTRKVRSDGLGRFWFGDLAAGRYQLVTRVAGRPESAPLAVELLAGERNEELVLRLDSGGTIRGQVQDESGAPLAGVYVSAQGERLDDARARPAGHVHVVTHSDGLFHITGLPEGEYTLRAYPLETPGARDEPWLPATVEHVATGAQPLTIELTRGAAIRGELRDAGGAALAGYVVACVDAAGRSEEYAQTDELGRFALTVTRGSRWALEVRGAPQDGNFQRVLLRRADVAAGTSALELRIDER